MSQQPTAVEVIQALMVTAEITGTQLSEPAARIFAADLGAYPPGQVLGALKRCRREVRGRLTVADVVGRLEDGRPTPDEAWAMLPQDEAATAVLTEEMAQAWGVSRHAGDRVSARLAFLSAYRRLVSEARDAGIPAKWFPSLGSDPHARAAALDEAARLGRISAPHARALECRGREIAPEVAQLATQAVHRLPAPGGGAAAAEEPHSPSASGAP